MLTAHFIGNHDKDTLLVRAGWAITRSVQRGTYANVTHCEAIHAEHDDGTVTIASASLRDGGVRTKRVKLNPAHWLIVDVPAWDVQQSIDWFAFNDGVRYDLRGALATVLLFGHDENGYFCNEAVGSPFMRDPAIFGPAQFASLCMSFGRDVTAEFFTSRERAAQ